MLKQLTKLAGVWVTAITLVVSAHAQIIDTNNAIVTNTFMGTISSGWSLGGSGYTPELTSGKYGDLANQGWLRLTANSQDLATFARYNTALPSRNTTIYAEFEFLTWGSGSYGAADGITFFLYDGSKTFNVGAYGGSLGYAQKTGIPGLSGGYMGLALDDWGNYSNPTEGRIGGPGFLPNSIVVRGPGSGEQGYEYISGTGANGIPALLQEMDFPSATTRPDASLVRKVTVTLSPGNQLTVTMQFGSNAPVQVLYIADLSLYTRPETLGFGFTAGTGTASSYHEIRNFQIQSRYATLWDRGGGNNYWSTEDNWSPNGIPGLDILFNNAYISSPQTVDLGGTVRQVWTMTLDSPYAFTLNNGTIQFGSSGTNTAAYSLNSSKVYGDAAQVVNANISTTGPLLIKNTADSLFTIGGNITNNGNTITFDGTSAILTTGQISGAGSLVKQGTGNLILDATNTYTGGTILNAGSLSLGEDTALGSGALTINDTGAGTLLQSYGQAVTISNRIILNSDTTIGGATDLALLGTLTQSNGNRTITVNNTALTTFSNINLSANNTGYTLTMDVAKGSTSVVSGEIANGGSGAGGLTKNGEGTLRLDGAATYTGSTILNAGTLLLGASDRLPDASNLYLNGGTLSLNGNSDQVALLSYGNATLDFGAGSGANYFLFNNDGVASGTLVLQNWTTADRFAYNASQSVSNSFLENLYFAGIGAGGEVKRANQDQPIAGYSGNWDIITPISHPASIWDGGSSLSSGWSYRFNWNNNNLPSSDSTTTLIFGESSVSGARLTPVLDEDWTVNSLVFSNVANVYNITNSGGSVLTFAGIMPNIIQKSPYDQTISAPLSLSSTLVADTYGAGSLTLSGPIAGAGGITKVSTGGPLILSGNNTYTGNTVIQQGVVNIRSGTALGSTGAGTEVQDGAALEIQGGITVGAEALSLAGMGVANGGALRNVSGNNSMAGAITLAQDARINSDSGTLTLSGNIGGAGNDLYVGGAGNVTLNGAIGTGTGQVTKEDTGILTLGGAGANTFTGGLTINSGTVLLNKTAGVDALKGPITLGDGLGSVGSDVLRLNNSNQIADTAILGFKSSGLFDLAGYNETIAGINSTSTTAQITLGSGTLKINSFENSDYAGTISGSGGLIKDGANTLTLSGSNSYAGLTVVTNGVLNIRSGTALGSSAAGTIVNTGATLQVQNNITVTNEALTLGGAGVSGTGALRNLQETNTWTGTVTLSSNARVASDSGLLYLNGLVGLGANTMTVGGAGNTWIGGVVSGAGGLNKDGTGTLTLTNANTYAGATLISNGVVNIRNNTALGTNTSGTTVKDGAALEVQNNITVTGEALTLGGSGINDSGALRNIQDNNTWAGSVALSSNARINSDAGLLALNGAVGLGANTLTVGGAGNTLVGGVISGTGGLNKDGTGTLTLTNANTYAGATLISNGVVNIRNNTALGANTSGTTVKDGAALQLQNNITVTGEALTLGGSGVSGTGALRNMQDNNTWSGSVTLASSSTIQSDSGVLNLSGSVSAGGNNLIVNGPGDTTISGVLSGSGSLTKNGTGTLKLSGTADNTFTGDTTVNAGTLVLAKSDGKNAIADSGTTKITVNSGGTLLWGANNQLANGVDITLNGGTINMANYSEGTTSAAGLGTLTLAANSIVDLGTASTSILHFDATAAATWTSGTYLTVNNWSGNLSGGGTEGLYFGTATSGLTSGQLAQIRFYNPAGFAPGYYPARILPSGEVVPVPEPATYVAMAMLLALVGWRERRRLAGWLKAIRAAR